MKNRIFYIGTRRYKCEFDADGFTYSCFIKKSVWYGWEKVYKNPYIKVLHADTFIGWNEEYFDKHIDETIQLFKEL